MGYIDHAVRRGLTHVAGSHFRQGVSDAQPVEVNIPGWGVAIIVVTMIVFIVFMSLIEYTLKDVVATLAMVETPAAAITVSASEESAPKDVKEGLLETGPTITLIHQKPITSSIRGTIKHLAAHAGRFSRFRGIKSLILYQLCFSFVANIIDKFVPLVVPGRLIIITALSGGLLANLHATWTHKVISMPTTTKFWQRVVPRSNWKVLALPAAIEASTKYLSMYIAQGFVLLSGLDETVINTNFGEYTGNDWTYLILRVVAVFIIMLACVLFIVLPALVTLVRVEASILPEDQDTIVPFDRTFAGKVVPKILGGTGCIGFLDAWRSFNWEARGRLIKLYVKFFLIITTLMIILTHVMAFELWAILGPELGKALTQAKQRGFRL